MRSCAEDREGLVALDHIGASEAPRHTYSPDQQQVIGVRPCTVPTSGHCAALRPDRHVAILPLIGTQTAGDMRRREQRSLSSATLELVPIESEPRPYLQ